MQDLIVKNDKNMIELFNADTNYISYKNKVFNIPSLSLSEEKNLVSDLFLGVNERMLAAQKLIMAHLKLVVKMAKDYKNYGLNEEDLVQEGNLGLMQSVKNYNPSYKVRVATYAIIYIKSAMQEYVINNWKIVKIATTKSYKKLFFNYRKMKNLIEDLQGSSNRKVSQLIANELGVNKEEVDNIANYFMNNDVFLLQDTEDGLLEYDIRTDITPESLLIEKQEVSLLDSVKEELKNLGSDERYIIEKRYIDYDKKTYKQIGSFLGYSDERIRQLEKKIIYKIKNRLLIN